MFFICLMILFSCKCFSQVDNGLNEVKADVLGLAFNRIGVGYERLIGQNSGIGSVFFLKKGKDYYIIPYYRYYFGEDSDGAKLFVEGSGLYYSYISKDYDGNFYDDGKRNAVLGGGLGFGGKGYVYSNFFLEGMISSRIGKVLKTTEGDKLKIVFQATASVGYRF